MITFGELCRRLWYFLRRDQLSRELEEEMRLHVELRAESLRRRQSNGMAVDDRTQHLNINNDQAYYAARRRFGNTTELQQRSQDMWGFARVDDFTRDLRFAARRLVQQRGFSLSVIGVMAIGIGAVTAMFSAVDAALLRPLPFQSPEQLIVVGGFRVPTARASQTGGAVRTLDITDLRTMKQLFSDVAAYAAGAFNLRDEQNPVRVKAGVVTSNFFSTLGIQPLRGRVFNYAEEQMNGPNVAVLSYGLWQRQYGGRDLSDFRIKLGTRSFEVIGVMPRGFSFPSESELWVPMTVPTTAATMEAFRGFNPSVTFARLLPGVAPDVAARQLLARVDQWYNLLDAGNKATFKDRYASIRLDGVAVPLQQKLVGDRKTAMIVLLGATGLLLLIACVNVTSLLLSQAAARQRELAVRQVLGATRVRIVRQLLTESIMLSVVGAGLGVVIAPLPLRLLRVLQPAALAGVAPIELNLRVLSFSVVVALLTGIAFGLWPAFRSSSQNYGATIKSSGGHGATSGSTGRIRRLLVSAELALTVTLLIGAGLMLRSFNVLMQRDSGWNSAQVGTLEMTLATSGNDRADGIRRLNETLARLSAMPGVQSAGAVNDLPLNGEAGIRAMVDVPGAPPPKGADGMRYARFLFATSDYFPAMGIKLMRGRLFTATDDSLAPDQCVQVPVHT